MHAQPLNSQVVWGGIMGITLNAIFLKKYKTVDFKIKPLIQSLHTAFFLLNTFFSGVDTYIKRIFFGGGGGVVTPEIHAHIYDPRLDNCWKQNKIQLKSCDLHCDKRR